MASSTSKPPSKPVQALIVYNRYCWCADEVCVIVLSLRYYYMHFLQSCQDGVLLFSVLVVIPDAISQCIFTAARRNVPAS